MQPGAYATTDFDFKQPRASLLSTETIGRKHPHSSYEIFDYPAELAVMGAAGAVEIVNRREILESDDPDAKKAELVEEYSEKFLNPYAAADRGYVDDVIDPADTRRKVNAALDMLESKREELPARKHGNVPL